jgi:glycosyltransferase involved in cell wall biosynthesis
VVWLARLLWGRRIVFDAFLSLYDSNVLDRRVHAKGSIKAHLDRFWDNSSCLLAGTVLLDTAAHIDYFVHEYGLPKEKFHRVFIGTDLQPLPSATLDENLVHFHGSFIPLHGIETILAAAQELSDTPLHVTLLGRGQEYWRMRELAASLALTNVDFKEPVPPSELPAALGSAAICLGVFGATAKTSRVIPNKIYEYVAMGKAIITADTPAIHELEAFGPLPFVLVPAGDAHALADAIRALAAEGARRCSLGESARALHEAHLTSGAVVRRLLAHLA